MKTKIKVCQNHLAHFFEALVRGEVEAVRRVEHQLTAEEECVACAYLLRARGEARNEAEEFLVKEGFLGHLTARSAPEGSSGARSGKVFLLFFLLAAVVSGLLALIFWRSAVYFG